MALPEISDDLPLAGIRVLDFGTTLAGPCATRHLSDFGAQVIKVESEVHPDTLRVGTPFAGGAKGLNRSAYFAAYNAGKLSFSLNLKAQGAMSIVRALVERSDILVETYAPGVTERLGLTYDLLRTWNPQLIMASHSLQGQWGPHSRLRGYGQIASAMSGWLELTGYEGGEPVGPYSAYTDFIAWPYLVTALLTALDMRDHDGRGQHIDHSQMESSLQFLAPLLLDSQLHETVPTRRGNHEDYACPNNTYQCSGDEGWIAVTIVADKQWESLCHVLGHGEFAYDDRFRDFEARKSNEAEVDNLLDGWFRSEKREDAVSRLQEAGIAAGPVLDAKGLFEDPQLHHRQFFRPFEHTEIGVHSVLSQSFQISGVSPGPARAAPLIGEHTYDICREVLEMSDEEVSDCIEAGVLM